MNRTPAPRLKGQFPFEVKLLDDRDGSFEGHAAVFGNVDRGGDRILPGAFKRTLREWKGRPIPLFWRHSEIIGTADVKEDERGLFVKGFPLADVQRGREAIALMRAQAVQTMSFGYVTRKAADDAEGVRELKELELIEVSLEPVPMNPEARLTSVKTWDSEQAVRDALSASGAVTEEQAARAASVLWADVLQSQRNSTAEVDELLSGIESLTRELRGD